MRYDQGLGRDDAAAAMHSALLRLLGPVGH